MTKFYPHHKQRLQKTSSTSKMNFNPDEAHDVGDFNHMSKGFLCNILNNVYVKYDYLMCKLEFSDDELFCSLNPKLEIIKLVTKAIFTTNKFHELFFIISCKICLVIMSIIFEYSSSNIINDLKFTSIIY